MILYIMYCMTPMPIVCHWTHLYSRIVYVVDYVKLKAYRLKAVVLNLAHG
jgi:hypothetical protein